MSGISDPTTTSVGVQLQAVLGRDGIEPEIEVSVHLPENNEEEQHSKRGEQSKGDESEDETDEECPPDGGCWQQEDKHEENKRNGKCPPGCQQYEKEEVLARRREEQDKRERIEKPWLYETQKPMSEPPDINYRKLILYDQESIDQLLEDENLHFTERCLRYQEHDVWIEGPSFVQGSGILKQYKKWCEHMLNDARALGDGAREKFFEDLFNALQEDNDEVDEEWRTLYACGQQRERLRFAQLLNIPANAEEWPMEHKWRYLDSDEHVSSWPGRQELRDSLAEEGRGRLKDTPRDNESNEDESANNPPTNQPTTQTKPTSPIENPTPSLSQPDEDELPAAESIDEAHPSPPSREDVDTPLPPTTMKDMARGGLNIYFKLAVLVLLMQLVIEIARRRFGF